VHPGARYNLAPPVIKSAELVVKIGAKGAEEVNAESFYSFFRVMKRI